MSTFSEGLLQPLEEVDRVFQLEIRHTEASDFLKGISENMPRENMDSMRAKVPLIKMKKMPQLDLFAWAHDHYLPMSGDNDPLNAICYMTKDLLSQKKRAERAKAEGSSSFPAKVSSTQAESHHGDDDDHHDDGRQVFETFGLLSHEGNSQHVTINITPEEDAQNAYEDSLRQGEFL